MEEIDNFRMKNISAKHKCNKDKINYLFKNCEINFKT